MSAFNLPKIAHPDFALPGRKPVGPVEVDWGNPLNKNLRVALNPLSGDFKDLVNAKTVNTEANASVSGGLMHVTADIDGQFTMDAHPDLTFDTYFTVTFRVYIPDVTGSKRFFSIGVDSTSRIDVHASGNSVYLGYRHSGGTLTTVQFDSLGDGDLTAGWNTVTVSYDGANAYSLLNSESIRGDLSTKASANGPVDTTAGVNLDIGAYLDGATHRFLGEFEYFFMWAEALPVASLFSVHNDPYRQVLKPTAPLLYVIPDVVADATAPLVLYTSPGLSVTNP